MTRIHPIALIVALIVVPGCTSSAQQPAEKPAPVQKAEPPKQETTDAKSQPAQPVNIDAQTLADFKARLDTYVDLRGDADDTAQPMKETKEPADIQNAKQSLAERLALARKGAKQGDIFTPPVATLFRRLLRPEMKEPGTAQQIHDDNPGAGVPLTINAPYPETEPLSTVPPNVLETLPPLPKDIEYRFVKTHLILRDTRANLIIDYLVNAIP